MKTILFIASFVLLTATAEARNYRATEMSPSSWAQLLKGGLEDAVVEFRAGDELPVSFVAEGELLETKSPGVNYVTIKKNFWLRPATNTLEISFDGSQYRDVKEALTGRIEAGAKSDENGGPANGINILFKAFLK